jgi:hypothetical protein
LQSDPNFYNEKPILIDCSEGADSIKNFTMDQISQIRDKMSLGDRFFSNLCFIVNTEFDFAMAAGAAALFERRGISAKVFWKHQNGYNHLANTKIVEFQETKFKRLGNLHYRFLP